MDLVIAVGGGGQHIALSIARLLRIGALSGPVEAFVIDADSDSRLATKLRYFGNTVNHGSPHPLSGAQTIVPPFARDAMKEPRAVTSTLGTSPSSSALAKSWPPRKT